MILDEDSSDESELSEDDDDRTIFLFSDITNKKIVDVISDILRLDADSSDPIRSDQIDHQFSRW